MDAPNVEGIDEVGEVLGFPWGGEECYTGAVGEEIVVDGEFGEEDIVGVELDAVGLDEDSEGVGLVRTSVNSRIRCPIHKIVFGVGGIGF